MSLLKKLAIYSIGTKTDLIANEVSGIIWDTLPLIQSVTGIMYTLLDHSTSIDGLGSLIIGVDGITRIYNACFQKKDDVKSPLSGPGIIGNIREKFDSWESRFQYRRE